MHNFEGRFQEIKNSGYQLEIKKLLKDSWQLFWPNKWILGAMTLATIILTVIAGQIGYLGPIVSNIVVTILGAGIALATLKIVRGEKIELTDLYKAFPFTLTLILTGLLSGLFIILGSLLIIPGIYLAVAYSFTTLFIIDKEMDFWESMEYSRKIISMRWFSFLGLIITMIAIIIVGALCLGIGILFALPYCALVTTLCYKQITEV